MSLAKKKAVIADDEPHIRALMKVIMETMGVEIIAQASNVQEAVDFFQKLKPDVLLMDINMPVKTGLDALREIKAQNKDACVIMLSSVADMGSVKEAIELGALQFIRKDTPITEIKKIIAETCESFLK